MKTMIYKISSFILIVLLASSCKKMVTVDLPKNQLVTKSVFLDSSDANSAIIGIYSSIMQYSNIINLGSGAVTVFSGLAGDELLTTNQDIDIQQFYSNRISSQNSTIFGMWKFAYQIIYHANACIEGLEQTKSLPQNFKSRLLGEAKFIRAWFYFSLINFYGGVPLVTNIDYTKNSKLARSSEADVYRHIINDLLDAENLMEEAYISQGKLRPNRHTATALLSRVYLYQQEWEKAEEAASRIINSGLYQLETDLNDVFLNTSNESIWQMPPLQQPLGVPECRQFIGTSSSIPNYPITTELLNSFNLNDQRRIKWINSKVVNGLTYFFPYKYKLRSSSTSAEHYVVFRLGELMLNRAEARFQNGDLAGGLEDLNQVRMRAGLSGHSLGSKEYLLDNVYEERRLELFCEWGHRWNDLKRLNLANSVLQNLKADWQQTDQLFPIPQSELESNPALMQNPGY